MFLPLKALLFVIPEIKMLIHIFVPRMIFDLWYLIVLDTKIAWYKLS